LAARLDPGFIGKSGFFDHLNWDVAEERVFFLVDVLRVGAEMPFSKPVEVAVDLRAELFDVFFIGDDNFEMAA